MSARSRASEADSPARRVSGVADELGRVPELGRWVARVQGGVVPQHFRRVRAVLIDTPVDTPAERPEPEPAVADDPDDETAAPGTAASAMAPVPEPDQAVLDVLADRAGAGRRVVDVVTGPEPARGELLPELPPEEYEAAFELGRYVADEEADAGTDLLVVGVGRSTREHDLTAATALVAALLDREPIPLIGTDTARGNALGLDDRTWARRVTGVRDLLRRTRSEPPPAPVDLVRRLAGSRIAMLTGLLQQAAERRTAVVLDGTVTCAAALATDRLAPGSRAWWLAAAVPAEPAGRVALAELGLVPLLDLGTRSGTGAAGLLAVGVLAGAVDAVGALVEVNDTSRKA